MIRITLIIIALVMAGCATTYKNPTSDSTADLKVVLKEPLKVWATVSFFEGMECTPSPNGEYGGDLHNGSWTQDPSETLDFKIDSGKLVSMEIFERTIFTAEIVYSGQYCKNLLAFTPEKGASYLIEYWPNCKYTFVNQATNEPVVTQTPTGKCHSKNMMGAYK